MFISWPVSTERVLGLAKLAAVFTVISTTAYMFQFYVVSHVGCVLADMVTVRTLPQAGGILPHLGLDQS